MPGDAAGIRYQYTDYTVYHREHAPAFTECRVISIRLRPICLSSGEQFNLGYYKVVGFEWNSLLEACQYFPDCFVVG